MDKSIYSKVPVNKTAAIVTSKGYKYVPYKKIVSLEQDTPIDTKIFKGAEDLTGVIFGRFTVLGMAKNLKGRWVVRCDCGIYATRWAKAIKNKENSTDRCGECRHLMKLKRTEFWRRTGKDVDNKDIPD